MGPIVSDRTKSYVRTQHDGRLLRGGQCDHLERPGEWRDRIRNVRYDLAREPLITVRVDDRKGDGIGCVVNDGKVSLL